MLSFEMIESEIERRLVISKLIAIDGLPLSGKTTLAERLSDRFGLRSLAFDDFFAPSDTWPADIVPGFPFPFFRVDEFRSAVQGLHDSGSCVFYPFDWEHMRVDTAPRTIEAQGPVIVEGCSVLDPVLAPLYDLSLFIESDRKSVLDARRARDGVDSITSLWSTLFLPSVDAYMSLCPQRVASYVVAGRGLEGGGIR